MKLSVSIDLPGTPAQVLDYLLSAEYLIAAAASSEQIVSATEELREDDAGTSTQAVRWVAPTKLPSILKRFEGRAPESVNWLERAVWDHASFTASLTVHPDVPASWNERYRSSGVVRIEPSKRGSVLHQELEFSMDFGLVGRALEKLLKNEIETLLKQRLAVLQSGLPS